MRSQIPRVRYNQSDTSQTPTSDTTSQISAPDTTIQTAASDTAAAPHLIIASQEVRDRGRESNGQVATTGCLCSLHTNRKLSISLLLLLMICSCLKYFFMIVLLVYCHCFLLGIVCCLLSHCYFIVHVSLHRARGDGTECWM